MTDLLIRDIDPALRRQLKERARAHSRSLSEEAKLLIRRGLSAPLEGRKLGTEMFNMVRPEDRGDDLVFEYPDNPVEPPDFE